jgi:hypothetical protein
MRRGYGMETPIKTPNPTLHTAQQRPKEPIQEEKTINPLWRGSVEGYIISYVHKQRKFLICNVIIRMNYVCPI